MVTKLIIDGCKGKFINHDKNASVNILCEVFMNESDARKAFTEFHKDTSEKIIIFKDFDIDYLHTVIKTRGDFEDDWTIRFELKSPA